jgi:hypothetical protein
MACAAILSKFDANRRDKLISFYFRDLRAFKAGQGLANHRNFTAEGQWPLRDLRKGSIGSLKHLGGPCGLAQDHLRRPAELQLEACDPLAVGTYRSLLHERHRAPAKSGSGQTRAVYPGRGPGLVHQPVQLRAGDLEQVAQAHMKCVHLLPEAGQVARTQGPALRSDGLESRPLPGIEPDACCRPPPPAWAPGRKRWCALLSVFRLHPSKHPSHEARKPHRPSQPAGEGLQ